MAIDSEDKRRSAGPRIFGMPAFGTMPTPDSDVDAADRLHYSGFYRGITLVTPVRNGGFLLKVYRP
jgi:hypothetical protein